MFKKSNAKPNNIENETPVLVPVKPLPDGENVTQLVETKRAAILKDFKKTRMISRILMTSVVILVMLAILFITMKEMGLKIAGYSIGGAILIAMLVYYIFNRNKFPNISKQYSKEITEAMNSYVFSDSRFSEVCSDPNKKLTRMEFAVDKAYKEAADVGSRNYVVGKFNELNFEISDAALYDISTEKRGQRKVVFLGKYLSLPNKLDFEGRYIFNLKNSDKEKLMDQPTAIDDLSVESDDIDLTIYGPEGKHSKNVFGTEFAKLLKEIRIESPLLNVVVVAWAGHSGVYLSYDDAVISLPFEHEYNNSGLERYRLDLLKMLELFERF